MEAKVLKPIPGAGYSIGETAEFDDSASQWLLDGKYIEIIEAKKSKPNKEDIKPETATKKASENAAKPSAK